MTCILRIHPECTVVSNICHSPIVECGLGVPTMKALTRMWTKSTVNVGTLQQYAREYFSDEGECQTSLSYLSDAIMQSCGPGQSIPQSSRENIARTIAMLQVDLLHVTILTCLVGSFLILKSSVPVASRSFLTVDIGDDAGKHHHSTFQIEKYGNSGPYIETSLPS